MNPVSRALTNAQAHRERVERFEVLAELEGGRFLQSDQHVSAEPTIGLHSLGVEPLLGQVDPALPNSIYSLLLVKCASATTLGSSS
jgi:hypothetical protein